MSKRLLALTILTIFTQIVFSQKIKYRNCTNCWNADSLGNHRAVLVFNGNGKIAHAVIDWRRNDNNPQNKRIILQDAQTGEKILNVKTGNINNERGEIFFEPLSGKGNYYAYYMPYKNEGRSSYPKGVYLSKEETASEEWQKKIDFKMPVNTTVTELQAIDSFNSFYPMEVIATAKETNAVKAKYAQQLFIVFPEDRMYPIRMKNYLPYKWIQSGAQKNFKGEAYKSEYYAYQLGVFALTTLEDVKVTFTNMRNEKGQIIPANGISCINTTGVSYDAKPFSIPVNIEANTIQPLWCEVAVPANAMTGIYSGKAIVSSKNTKPVEINISLTVKENTTNAISVNEPYKMTRLHWLNSTMAQQNDVIAPYTSLQLYNTFDSAAATFSYLKDGKSISFTSGNIPVDFDEAKYKFVKREDKVLRMGKRERGKEPEIRLLGRSIIINNDGFPKQISSAFTPEMTSISSKFSDILYESIHFHFTKKSDGKDVKFKNNGVSFTEVKPGTIQWESKNVSDSLQMNVTASLEFDGFVSYKVCVIALQDIDFKNITFHIPYKKDMAEYMMGLGQKGGYRPPMVNWKWDVANKNQDGAWIGNVNAGIQFSLRDEKYVRPLNTNFYLQKPLLLPASWGNNNKGGIDVGEKGSSMLVNCYSGERTMKKGDTLYYNFNLLVTPFHPINTDFQWNTRFYHAYNSIDSIKKTEATVINIHHATPINPWINYPFIEWKKMKSYIDEAHENGLKVKIYNTVRELSNHAYETYPLRSLGHEVYSPGKGGGFSWLQEHLDSDYIAAWFVPEIKDAAIINSGMNRWHNYYVEGMNWLTQNVGIDGIYLDDVAFDRITMKRIKRVLTKDGHSGIIDLHSANQYNKSDGFNNSANLYMEHFPYLNRLWFGEYFDYEKNAPDFFLTEVSGIPFGLMGEMLENGGNPWRGMIYGMTNRMPWTANSDPRPIWKLWNDFDIKGADMIGYWSKNCPVKTDNEKVLATVYKKNGKSLVSIASWADADVNIHLQIDWEKLGINPAKATMEAPEINNFQITKVFSATDDVPVEKGKGWLIVIKEK